MITMTIQVPDDSVEFVEEFVERIGGNVEEKAEGKIENRRKPTLKTVKPLDFFGTWTDIHLDPETHRKKLWRNVPQL